MDPVFQGSTASHQWECLRCDHRWNATFASLRPERRKCPRCSRRRRRFQVLFFGAIKAFLPEAQYEAKGVLGRLEADIWLPNLRVVIEPGARVWHGYSGREERDRRARLRDRRKEAMCRRLGIRLVRVWYEDFEQQPGIVLTQVAKALGLAPGEFTECFERLRGNPTDEMRDLLHKRLASSREQRKILRLVLAGVRPAEIARQTGLPRWIVYRVLAEERLSVPDRVPPPLQAELARRFTEERCSILRLSEEYGISRAIITKRLRDRGLRPRKGSGLEQPIADQHGTVYPSQAEAARRLGLRQGNISHVLARKRTSVGGYRFSYVLPRPTRSTSPARPPQ